MDNPIVALAFVAAILGVLVKMYLMVFKPDVWKTYEGIEEEKKAKRAERLEKAAKGGVAIWKFLKKK